MQFQTIDEFMTAPFGEPIAKRFDLDNSYKKLRSSKRIFVEGYTMIDDDYLIHIKVGSETNNDIFYDVILCFFTDNEDIKKSRFLTNYYLKFFSNSPSFIYKYAVLFKNNGYMIDMLYDKMEAEFSDKLPEKSNAEMKLGCDKSIYCACKLLQEQKHLMLSKFGIILRKKKPVDKFLADIKGFSDIKFDQEIKSFDKKLDKEMDEVLGKNSGKIPEKLQKRKSQYKGKKTSTTKILSEGSKPGVRVIKKKTGSKIGVKKPKRSTR